MKIKNQYRLAGEKDSSFEIHDTKDNTRFHVAKKGLTSGDIKSIKGIKKYADGGEVDDDGPVFSPASPIASVNGLMSDAPQSPAPATAAPAQDAAPSPAPDKFDTWSGNDDGAATTPAPALTNADQVSTSPAPAAPSAMAAPGSPKDSGNMMGQLRGGIAQQKAGILGQAGVTEDTSNAIAQAQEDHNKQMADLQTKSAQDAAAWKSSLDDLSKQASTTIDPNHYVNSMTTGNRIMAGIGLMLSGIGSGLSGQQNMAQQNIQKSIDRDIETQKENQSNKKSLYQINLQRFNDDRLATIATQNQMNAGLQGTIAAMASRNTAQSAKFIAQQEIGKLQQASIPQQAELQSAMYEQGVKRSLLTGAANPNLDPSVYVQHVVPAAQQPAAYQAIAEAQETAKNGPAILAAFDKAAKTWHANDLNPVANSADQDVFKTLLSTTMKGEDLQARQAGVDALYNQLKPSHFKTDSDITSRRAGLVSYLQGKSNAPVLKGNNIDLTKYNSTRFNADPNEGKTASDAKGNKLTMKNGQWVKLGK